MTQRPHSSQNPDFTDSDSPHADFRRANSSRFDATRFLAEITRGRHYGDQISHIVALPSQEARFGELSAPLPAALREALSNLEIGRLFTHQAAAVEAARNLQSFVVVTATASGKTLCYHLPILERRLQEIGARALYLYPTKALAQDQLRGLLRLQDAGEMAFKCGTYDGDTPSSTRSALRDRADFILTNPDMLHAGILPSHAKWAPFFEKLRFVVIDEVHTYRGIFGSNVANVMRRLQRICVHYGSNPQFICASATIANPQELCESLCATDFQVIDDDGAPRGEKHFVLWNPPLIDKKPSPDAQSRIEYSKRAENAERASANRESSQFPDAENPNFNRASRAFSDDENAKNADASAGNEYSNRVTNRDSQQNSRDFARENLDFERANAAKTGADSVRGNANNENAEREIEYSKSETANAASANGAMTRRSPNSEAQHLLTALMRRGVPTIAFVRARVVAELLLRYTQDELARRAPSLLQKLRAYRAGYLASERREIEQQLFDGELLGVVATSALELGIDVGGLDACLLVGYPGSIASTWQRAGRAGRSNGSSLAILIAGDGPIDQYLMHNPEYLFGQSPEHAVLDADNAYILAKHLRCACAELPVSLDEARRLSQYAPALLQLLEEEGQLRRAGNAWFWANAGVPSRDVSLRNIGDNTYSIVDADRKKIIGTVDESTAFQTVHTGAIYLHEAETYHIEKLDLSIQTAFARRHDADYFTQTLSEANIRIEEIDEEKSWRESKIGFGQVGVTISIPSYKKIKFGSLDTLGFGNLDLPPQTLDTAAVWIAPPPEALRRLREMGRVPQEGVLGIANAAVGVMPLRVMCDMADIGAVVDSTQLGTPALFLFDKYPGGLGLAQRGYDLIESILSAAHEMISTCECDDGCPSCVGSGRKTYTYYDAGGQSRERIPDKEAALVVLHEMLGLEPYQPRGERESSTRSEPIEQLPAGLESKVRQQLQRLKGL